MSRYRVAVDVGGTFTDFVIQDTHTGTAVTNKVLSTTQDQAQGVLAGLREEVEDLTDVASLVHGNTVGLNALLERRGTRVLLVTTEGFRDTLRLGRGIAATSVRRRRRRRSAARRRGDGAAPPALTTPRRATRRRAAGPPGRGLEWGRSLCRVDDMDTSDALVVATEVAAW